MADDPYAQFQDADPYAQFADAKQDVQTGKTPAKLGVMDYVAGLPEAAMHIGSSMLAAPVSGIAGIGQMMNNTLGLSKGDPAEAVKSVQNAMTYSPGSAGGKAVSNAVAYPFQKFADMADYAGRTSAASTGSPAYGAATNAAIQGLPLLFGAKIPGRSIPKPQSLLSPEVAESTGAGLNLTPEQAGGGLFARSVQSLAGSAKLERSISLKNSPVVNNMAKEDIGIPQSTPLSDESIAAAKAPHNAIYGQVSRLGPVPTDATYQSAIANLTDRTGSGSFGFDVSPQVQALKDGYGGVTAFDAADAVAKVRQLRRDSNVNQKIYDPEKNALGQAQRGVADALDDQLDRHVQTLSQSGAVPPDLISQLRNSRVQLAKINTVQNALQGPNVSAKLIAKQDRGQLDGNLSTISNAYTNFDRSLQDVSKIRDSGPFGSLDTLLGVGLMHESPAALAAILARPLARSALNSPLYQKLGIQGGSLSPGTPSFPGLLGSGKLLPLLTQRGLLTQDDQ